MADAKLEELFKAYAMFGNAKSDGKQITLSLCDKWMKEAGIIDGKKVNTTATGICFSKFKAKTLSFKQFMEYVLMLSQETKIDPNEMKSKLSKVSGPRTAGATTSDKSKVVDRMTDTSKYTGSHKERFDKSGKGKGKAGREDSAENTGYVGAYKHKDTYDKKHAK